MDAGWGRTRPGSSPATTSASFVARRGSRGRGGSGEIPSERRRTRRGTGAPRRPGHRPRSDRGVDRCDCCGTCDGEQQRVAIARALVNRPAVILADEPTGDLDPGRTAEVLALLRRLNEDDERTFVLVTHDPEVGAACDRMIRMRDGQVRDHGLSAVRGRLDDVAPEAATA
jgi:hypothetical protein